MKKKVRFIINPISGVGKKKILPKLIHKNLDHHLFNYDIVYTEHRGHAYDISEKASNEAIDVVCIVGGDGSVNEAASALVNRKTALAILPAGSGNGVARHLKVPMKLKVAIQNLNRGKVTKIDTLKLNDKTAIGVSGFGFDALIAKKFDDFHARGLMSYARLVLKEWKNYRGINLIINDKERYSKLLICSIANTSQFGNNFFVSPKSKVTDGQFEVVLIDLPHFLGLFKLFFRSILKNVHQSKHVKIIKTNRIQIYVENKLGHIDGDPHEYQDNLIEVKCVSKSLNVWL